MRPGTRAKRFAAATFIAVATATAPTTGAVPVAGIDSVQQQLGAIAGDPISLRQFFVDLPKGADLHHHLLGAVSSEKMLEWLAADGGCLSLTTYRASKPPCANHDISADSVATDPEIRDEVIRAWSMHGFTSGNAQSGHDHFFATFGLFDDAVAGPERFGDALAAVASQAARDHVLRLETKVTPNRTGSAALDQALQNQNPSSVLQPETFPDAFQTLEAAGLTSVVADAVAATDTILDRSRRTMQCQSVQPDPGCSVEVGLVGQTNRTRSPQEVFAYLATAFATAAADPRWVAVDLVAPEDSPPALSDYHLHMQMVHFLSTVYPQVKIDLHAGELVPGLVPAENLSFHIREAVLLAGTERVGHGVDIRQELDSRALMREMAQRGTTVEIALTSNQQILGVTAQASQFHAYREAGVPVVLATDDEGVEDTDLSSQYQLAFEWFGLSYTELKELSYQSVDSAFADAPRRAALRDRLDAAFADFEQRWD